MVQMNSTQNHRNALYAPLEQRERGTALRGASRPPSSAAPRPSWWLCHFSQPRSAWTGGVRPRPPIVWVGSIHRVLSCSSTSLSSGGAAGVTCKNAFVRPLPPSSGPPYLPSSSILLFLFVGAVIAIIKRIWKREAKIGEGGQARSCIHLDKITQWRTAGQANNTVSTLKWHRANINVYSKMVCYWFLGCVVFPC